MTFVFRKNLCKYEVYAFENLRHKADTERFLVKTKGYFIFIFSKCYLHPHPTLRKRDPVLSYGSVFSQLIIGQMNDLCFN